MDDRKQDRLPYVASLDGIRALAILGVFIFHIHPAALKGGFTGVDMFFVLSGFLITTIILQDIRAGGFSFREFYLRRIQRLLPNVIVTVLGVLLLWVFLLPPGLVVQPAWHGLWTLLNLSNIYSWRNLGSYWGPDASWAPLTHFWSLGIEEQFYLIFPGFLVVLARFQARQIRWWLIMALIVSFAACLYGTYERPRAAFYLLPTRGWELLVGSVLAVFYGSSGTRPGIRLGAKMQEALGWAGLVLLGISFVSIDEHQGFPGWIALLPTLGTALVILSVVNGETRVSRLLAKPPMVTIGKLSYSIYLWHWPLIIFGKLQAGFHGWPPLVGSAAGGLVGLVLGGLAFRWVEQPLRQRGPGRSWRLATIAAGFCIVIVYSGIIAIHPPSVDPGHRFDPPTFHVRLFDTGRGASYKLGADVRYADVYFPARESVGELWRTGGIIHLYGGGTPQVVVLGSSHALMYSKLIDDICRQKGLSVAFLAVDGGAPAFFETQTNGTFASPEELHEFNEVRRKWVRAWRPEVIFAIDRWDGRPRDFVPRLRAFLQETSPLAGRILFVAQVPVAEQGQTVNLRGFINWRWSERNGPPRLAADSNEPFRKQVVAAAEAATADFANLHVLRPDLAFYQKDGSVRYAEGRRFFYADDDHLTDAGAEEVRPLFEQAIAEAHAAAPAR